MLAHLRDDAFVMSTRGFTLIELLTAIALITVLMGIALPSMTRLIASVQIKSEAHRLLAAVSIARGSAMRRRESVTLCPVSGSGTLLALCGGRFDQGFGVKTEIDGEWLQWYSASVGHIQILNRIGSAPAMGSVTWDAKGFGNRNLTLSICHRGSDDNWALILNRVGRPRLARGWGRCPD